MSDHGTLQDNGQHVIEVGLDLFDRQLVDKDGRLAGRVDDVELTVPEDGGPPVVTALLAGPGVLAHRMDIGPGRWIESLRRRLSPSIDPWPPRISFGVVRGVGSAIDLAVSREDLDVMTSERWAQRIIEKIPGS